MPDAKPLSAEELDRIHLLAFTGSVDGRAYPGGSLRALQQVLAHANDLTARLAEAERKARAFDWLSQGLCDVISSSNGFALEFGYCDDVLAKTLLEAVEAAGRKE